MMPSITEAIGDVVKTLVSVACEFSARYPAYTVDADIYSFRFRRHSLGSCGDASTTLQKGYTTPMEGCCNCQMNNLSSLSLKRRASLAVGGRLIYFLGRQAMSWIAVLLKIRLRAYKFVLLEVGKNVCNMYSIKHTVNPLRQKLGLCLTSSPVLLSH